MYKKAIVGIWRTCLLVAILLMAILYVSAAQTFPLDWEFSTSGNTEGWSSNSSIQGLTVQNGNLSFQINGSDPAITVESIAVDAAS